VTTNERRWVFGGRDGDEVSVVLEPRRGHTADEVAQRLRDTGASEVAVLSPSFVSARAARAVLAAVEAVATVRPKATARMHRAAGATG
jgi:hypothetical protein